MNLLNVLFEAVAPLVQLAIVVGCFALLFLVVYNRIAAANIIEFLRDLYGLARHGPGYQPPIPHIQERKLHMHRHLLGENQVKRASVVRPNDQKDGHDAL